jgi:hypothetical protein
LTSVLFDGEAELPIVVERGRELSTAHVGDRTLERALSDLGAPPLTARQPMITVGSNASTAQLKSKFVAAGVSTIVPLVRCKVRGMRVGLIPKVSVFGYIPSAPVFEAGARSTLFSVWLDADQRAAVDATETWPYACRTLGDDVEVRVDGSGERLTGVDVYASAVGVLALERYPAPLATQTAVIERVLSVAHWHGRLTDVLNADDWVALFTKSPEARAEFAVTLDELGLIDHEPVERRLSA